MKFHLLPTGRRFRLDGEIYTKVTPLLGENVRTAEQRLIRRAANVEPLDGAETTTAAAPPRPIPAFQVAAALRAYHAECRSALDEIERDLDDEPMRGLRQRLEAAHRACLERLGLEPAAKPSPGGG